MYQQGQMGGNIQQAIQGLRGQVAGGAGLPPRLQAAVSAGRMDPAQAASRFQQFQAGSLPGQQGGAGPQLDVMPAIGTGDMMSASKVGQAGPTMQTGGPFTLGGQVDPYETPPIAELPGGPAMGGQPQIDPVRSAPGGPLQPFPMPGAAGGPTVAPEMPVPGRTPPIMAPGQKPSGRPTLGGVDPAGPGVDYMPPGVGGNAGKPQIKPAGGLSSQTGGGLQGGGADPTLGGTTGFPMPSNPYPTPPAGGGGSIGGVMGPPGQTGKVGGPPSIGTFGGGPRAFKGGGAAGRISSARSVLRGAMQRGVAKKPGGLSGM